MVGSAGSTAVQKKVAALAKKEDIQVFSEVKGSGGKIRGHIICLQKEDSMAGLCAGLSISTKKPTLVLAHTSLLQNKKTKDFLASHKPQIRLFIYSSPKEVEDPVTAFLQKSKKQNRRRFDINLRSDLYDFVSTEAEKMGISRSEMIRRILAG